MDEAVCFYSLVKSRREGEKDSVDVEQFKSIFSL